jgi:hypothetical protein
MASREGYAIVDGKWTRVLDEHRKCQYCGQAAIVRRTICHDCSSEQGAEYMPTLRQIEREAAAIREEWSEQEARCRAPHLDSKPFELQVVSVGALH